MKNEGQQFKPPKESKPKTKSAQKTERYQLLREVIGPISVVVLLVIALKPVVPVLQQAFSSRAGKMAILVVYMILLIAVYIIELKTPVDFDTARAQKKLFIPRRYGFGVEINPRNPFGILIYVLIMIFAIYALFFS